MNIFDCTRHYDSLKDALAPIKANLHLIAFKGDLLFPPSCMREIYDALCEMGREAKTNFVEIDSNYGHDAFLVEIEKFDGYIKKILKDRKWSKKSKVLKRNLALADKILNDLNKDDVSLEKSIKLHEQGKKLLNEAREILENAKLSIKQVDDE